MAPNGEDIRDHEFKTFFNSDDVDVACMAAASIGTFNDYDGNVVAHRIRSMIRERGLGGIRGITVGRVHSANVSIVLDRSETLDERKALIAELSGLFAQDLTDKVTLQSDKYIEPSEAHAHSDDDIDSVREINFWWG